MPNLIEVQKSSYEGFLQRTIRLPSAPSPACKRSSAACSRSKDFAERASLEFVSTNSKSRSTTSRSAAARHHYAAPLKVTLQLVVWDIHEERARARFAHQEQDVYMGDMPLMTDNGTFIVNGTERVIVSQSIARRACSSTMTRARPTLGKNLFAARIIPYRGSWLDFEFDART